MTRNDQNRLKTIEIDSNVNYLLVSAPAYYLQFKTSFHNSDISLQSLPVQASVQFKPAAKLISIKFEILSAKVSHASQRIQPPDH